MHVIEMVELSQTSSPSKASLPLLVSDSCRHAGGPRENLS